MPITELLVMFYAVSEIYGSAFRRVILSLFPLLFLNALSK